jgi:hypothetical protein
MAPLLESLTRLHAHAALDADLREPLPASVVVQGKVSVYGSGRVRIGEHVLIYPDVHLETQGDACIELGDGLVISRGAHIVAMDGIKIGGGSLIGEYTSIRDANHSREPEQPIRDSGHSAKPITIGREVWLGRGVTVLGGGSQCSRDPRYPGWRDRSRHPCRTHSPEDPVICPDLFSRLYRRTAEQVLGMPGWKDGRHR